LEDEDESGNETVPMGWFVLLVVGLLGVLGWVVFQTMTGDPGGVSAENVGLANPLEAMTGTALKSAGDTEAERREAEAHFERMEIVVAGFLKARVGGGDVEVGEAPGTGCSSHGIPLRRNAIESLTFKSTDEYHIASLGSKPFIALKVRVEEQREGVPIFLRTGQTECLWIGSHLYAILPMNPEDHCGITTNGAGESEGLCPKGHLLHL
jgi:hypothetical protein